MVAMQHDKLIVIGRGTGGARIAASAATWGHIAGHLDATWYGLPSLILNEIGNKSDDEAVAIGLKDAEVAVVLESQDRAGFEFLDA